MLRIFNFLGTVNNAMVALYRNIQAKYERVKNEVWLYDRWEELGLHLMLAVFNLWAMLNLHLAIDKGIIDADNIIYVFSYIMNIVLTFRTAVIVGSKQKSSLRRICYEAFGMIAIPLCIVGAFYTRLYDFIFTQLSENTKNILALVIAGVTVVEVIKAFAERASLLYKASLNPIEEGENIVFDGNECVVKKLALFTITLSFDKGKWEQKITYGKLYETDVRKKAV